MNKTNGVALIAYSHHALIRSRRRRERGRRETDRVDFRSRFCCERSGECAESCGVREDLTRGYAKEIGE